MTITITHAGYSVRAIANWILDYAEKQGQTITNMALNKLVYFAYEAILLSRGRILTKAKIEAWDHGPVFREIYNDFKKFGDRPIMGRASFYSIETGKQEVSIAQLDPKDEAEIIEALSPLISLPASQLRAISHVEGSAWHRVWSYKGYANPGMEITPDIILSAADGR